jgi:hypothetical protein
MKRTPRAQRKMSAQRITSLFLCDLLFLCALGVRTGVVEEAI